MTLDEVIAGNVRRIREDKGWTVIFLAQHLGVGRHVVYDYERPRPGSAQRQFLWSDLVQLCDVLDVTLFDLVLPPEGSHVEGWTFRGEDLDDVRGVVRKIPDAREVELMAEFQRDGRSVLGEILFGAAGNIDPDAVKTLTDKRRQNADRVQELMRPVIEEALRKVIEEGEE